MKKSAVWRLVFLPIACLKIRRPLRLSYYSPLQKIPNYPYSGTGVIPPHFCSLLFAHLKTAFFGLFSPIYFRAGCSTTILGGGCRNVKKRALRENCLGTFESRWISGQIVGRFSRQVQKRGVFWPFFDLFSRKNPKNDPFLVDFGPSSRMIPISNAIFSHDFPIKRRAFWLLAINHFNLGRWAISRKENAILALFFRKKRVFGVPKKVKKREKWHFLQTKMVARSLSYYLPLKNLYPMTFWAFFPTICPPKFPYLNWLLVISYYSPHDPFKKGCFFVFFDQNSTKS